MKAERSSTPVEGDAELAQAETPVETEGATDDSSMLSERLTFQSEQLIDLPTLLDDLVKEGFIGQRQAEDILIAPRTKKELSQHPMEIVADRGYENRRKPGRELDLETLTHWLPVGPALLERDLLRNLQPKGIRCGY